MSKYTRCTTLSDLSSFLEKEVIVQFNDGREVEGILQNYDDRFNLFLTGTIEYIHQDQNKIVATGETRKLGDVFCKGNSILELTLKQGYVKID